MRRTASSCFLALLLTSAAAARAADVNLDLGIRRFGTYNERWPEVGVGVHFGPDAWRVRPVLGLALAEDPLFGGSITQGSAGIGGDLPHRTRATWSWAVGYARVRYEFGANEGEADAAFGELALRWVRPEEVDYGVSLRYLDGPDVALTYQGDPSGFSFDEPVSSVVLSFRLRW